MVGKFVEFYGEGLAHLPLADRATIANMAPEYGATCGFFPIDAEAIHYLRLSGRDDELTRQIRNAWPKVLRAAQFVPAVEYLQANRKRLLLMRDFADEFIEETRSAVRELVVKLYKRNPRELAKTPEANIRVDLLVMWPVLAILSVWMLFRAFR